MRSDDAAAPRPASVGCSRRPRSPRRSPACCSTSASSARRSLIEGRGGRRHRGTLVAVARDFCGLRTPSGRDILLSYAGIASVRAERRSVTPTGDRAVSLRATLDEALATLAEDRPRVLVVTLAGSEGLRRRAALCRTRRADACGSTATRRRRRTWRSRRWPS